MLRPPSDYSKEPDPAGPAPDTAIALETRLRELQDQFDLLKAQIRQAQQLSSLGTAAATIAHEVNNLLTPILSFARAAMQSDDPQLRQKALSITVKNVEILINMSERVLQLGAARAPAFEPVCLRSVVEDAAAGLCRDLSKDGIRFVVDVDPSLTVQADRLQLQQVFFNLFLNAREAMVEAHGGTLKVSAVRAPGGEAARAREPSGLLSTFSVHPQAGSARTTRLTRPHVRIEVYNTGEGIEPDLLPYIFEPFQSNKPVVREGRPRCGGLGLALCRDLIEEHGGTIEASSRAHVGTTFTICLPIGTRN